MQVKPMHPNFTMPSRSTDTAGGYDIYMTEAGQLAEGQHELVNLGFATAIPTGFVALILPRSGSGSKLGLELRNTCGVIDADYRGEWKAMMKTKEGHPIQWAAGDRLLQFVLVPVSTPELEAVVDLDATARGEGGFGSTGA